MNSTLNALADYICANIPLVAVNSPNCERLQTLNEIVRVANEDEYPVYVWELGRSLERAIYGEDGVILETWQRQQPETSSRRTGLGLRQASGGEGFTPEGFSPIQQFQSFLRFVEGFDPEYDNGQALFVVMGVHPMLAVDNPSEYDAWYNPLSTIVRLGVSHTAKRLVLLGQDIQLPNEFEGLSEVIDIGLPSLKEISEFVESEIALIIDAVEKDLPNNLSEDARKRLYRALQGFTLDECSKTLTVGARRYGAFDERLVALAQERKAAKMKRLGVNIVSPPKVSVAGMDGLTQWLSEREVLFSDEARQKNIPAPKGIVLVGIQGTGKTLAAKTTAKLWGFPVMAFSMNAIASKFFGDTEKNLERILKQAEANAPCVLFIDEIEKALAAGGGDTDGGVSQRVIGQLLSWLNDKTAPVFVIAAANDLTKLPPEMLRKGRFDEIFFVGLPNEAERAAILSVHFAAQGLEIDDKTLAEAAKESVDFVGSELEYVVTTIHNEKFLRGTDDEPVSRSEAMGAIASINPQAALAPEKIAAIISKAEQVGARNVRDIQKEAVESAPTPKKRRTTATRSRSVRMK